MKISGNWLRLLATTAAAVTVLTGCETTSKVPAATDEEKKEAFFNYFSCLHAAANKMDDGTSDAATIALAIKSVCTAEFNRTVEIQGRDLNPQARRMFVQKIQGQQQEAATQAVLYERARAKR